MLITRTKYLELSLVLLSLGMALTVTEVGLRYLTPFPITPLSNTIEHELLEYTLDPALPDVDEWGFRNVVTTPEEADLITIGDSHTYGRRVRIEQNFPSHLAKKTNRKIYNFGVGSYGIYHYKILLDRAIELNAKDVVLGFYIRNDLGRNCEILSRSYWRRLAEEAELTLPKCDLPVSLPPDSNRTLGLRFSIFFSNIWKTIKFTATYNAVATLVWDPLWRTLWTPKWNPEEYFALDANHVLSKNLVSQNKYSMSLVDKSTALNLENSKLILKEAQKKFDQNSVRFLVLLIPSKSLAYVTWARRKGVLIPPDLNELVALESTLVETYKDFFESNGIAYADALDHVVAAIERSDKDGDTVYVADEYHPSSLGYEAYADAALEGLRQLDAD